MNQSISQHTPTPISEDAEYALMNETRHYALRAVAREVIWRCKQTNSLKQSFSVSFEDNPFLKELFTNERFRELAQKSGGTPDKLSWESGCFWATVSLSENGGQVEFNPVFPVAFSERDVTNAVLCKSVSSETALLVREGKILSSKSLTTRDVLDYSMFFSSPAALDETELYSVQDFLFAFSDVPYFYTCDGDASTCLQTLSCPDKATISMNHVISGSIHSHYITIMGQPTLYCSPSQLQNLSKNWYYGQGPNNTTTPHSEAQNGKFSEEQFFTGVEKEIQGVIDKHHDEIICDVASIIGETHVKDAAEAEDTIGKAASKFPKSAQDGEPAFLFPDYNLQTAGNIGAARDPNHWNSWGGPNIKLPFDTKNYRLNQILFFVILRYLTKEGVKVDLQLVTNTILEEDSLLKIPF